MIKHGDTYPELPKSPAAQKLEADMQFKREAEERAKDAAATLRTWSGVHAPRPIQGDNAVASPASVPAMAGIARARHQW